MCPSFLFLLVLDNTQVAFLLKQYMEGTFVLECSRISDSLQQISHSSATSTEYSGSTGRGEVESLLLQLRITTPVAELHLASHCLPDSVGRKDSADRGVVITGLFEIAAESHISGTAL